MLKADSSWVWSVTTWPIWDISPLVQKKLQKISNWCELHWDQLGLKRGRLHSFISYISRFTYYSADGYIGFIGRFFYSFLFLGLPLEGTKCKCWRRSSSWSSSSLMEHSAYFLLMLDVHMAEVVAWGRPNLNSWVKEEKERRSVRGYREQKFYLGWRIHTSDANS